MVFEFGYIYVCMLLRYVAVFVFWVGGWLGLVVLRLLVGGWNCSLWLFCVWL